MSGHYVGVYPNNCRGIGSNPEEGRELELEKLKLEERILAARAEGRQLTAQATQAEERRVAAEGERKEA